VLGPAGEARAGELRQFPPDFRWCVATAAHQIEGGNVHSDWWDWEQQPGRIRNGERSGAACDHWNRLEEDVGLLKQLGVRQYRFSVEWARLEPEPGVVDAAAVAHYRREVELLEAAGIEPLVTLHHFTFPRWVRAKGGWEWEGVGEAFERFTRLVYTRIAPRARDWVTVNEPLVHLESGYVRGLTPPGVQGAGVGAGARDLAPSRESLGRLVPPLVGLLKAHVRAYRALHQLAGAEGRAVRVGLAHHLRVFDPHRPLWLDAPLAAALDGVWNWAVPDALRTGVLRASVPLLLDVSVPVEGLAGTQDFFGVNYYTRDRVSASVRGGLRLGMAVTAGARTNDMGWEVYPEGLYRVLMGVHARFPGLPIVLTENGTADRTDALRPAALRDHLLYLHKALREGARVEGYCHWSLMDNFEWMEGFGPRFGLYAVDYATQRRTPRGSAREYTRIIRSGGLEEPPGFGVPPPPPPPPGGRGMRDWSW
jgi:beta-glucosidase